MSTNGIFCGAFSSARAVIPMTRYFEWVAAADGGKDPFFIHHPDGGYCTLPGLRPRGRAKQTPGTCPSR